MAVDLSAALLLLLLYGHVERSITTVGVDPQQTVHLLQEQQVSHFQQYLQIRTAHPNPDYTSAISFLTSIANHTAPSTIRTIEFVPGKPLLILTYLGSDPSLPSILLNSHMDSVPADVDRWSHPPFAAFTRRAQDDKCIGVQYLEALRVLKTEGFVPVRTVNVVFTPDEKITGIDGWVEFAVSREFRELNVGFMLDEGQASPSEDFRVFYSERTRWRLILKAHGLPGHGSKLYDGSALENLMDAAMEISRFRDSQFDLVKSGISLPSDVISINPMYMEAGTPSNTGFQMNMQPSEGEMGFDVHLPPTVDPDDLRTRFAEWAPRTKNMSYMVIEDGPIRSYTGRLLITPTDSSNPWWIAFEQAITQSGGKLAKPEVLSLTTDSRFARQLDIPTLGFSPMVNTLLHQHNEFLQDYVFLQGIQVYTHVIRALSSLLDESMLTESTIM
ncbi:Aminoacylase [Zostera marina]|uniref:Aminoacylase n=1 Tax=Zostera marina TaxID=29655 RepID=A0A0K9Q118_ZOSMR|nr:Aminoacylase [Zostera marina]